ncbi:hypothetical protein HDU91_004030 [Kappamyces sp. JEL0680]|nr:hypothetical protein HDU91_004030 [Kappamyces sp. JEL0680]
MSVYQRDVYITVPVCSLSLALCLYFLLDNLVKNGMSLKSIMILLPLLGNIATMILSLAGVILRINGPTTTTSVLTRLAGLGVQINILSVALLLLKVTLLFTPLARKIITKARMERLRQTVLVVFVVTCVWNFADQFWAIGAPTLPPIWLGLAASYGTVLWGAFVIVLDHALFCYLAWLLYNFKKDLIEAKMTYRKVLAVKAVSLILDWLSIGAFLVYVNSGYGSIAFYLAPGATTGIHLAMQIVTIGWLARLVTTVSSEQSARLATNPKSTAYPAEDD